MQDQDKAFKDLKSEFSMFDGDGDSWNTAMWFFFTTALEIHLRGESCPAHWQYRPGAGQDSHEPDDYAADIVQAYETPVLIRFGNFLARHTRLLEVSGKGPCNE